jgi:hypothetical protein
LKVQGPMNQEWLPGNIMAAAEDEMGNYWLMHRGGSLTRINPESGHIQTLYMARATGFSRSPKSGLNAFLMIHQNKNGIWFQSFERSSVGPVFYIMILPMQNFSFYNKDFNFNGNGLPIAEFHFMEDRTGLLWLYTRPGMYKQSPKKRQMELYRHQPVLPMEFTFRYHQLYF